MASLLGAIEHPKLQIGSVPKRWPHELDKRVALRIALALPYVGFAIWMSVHGIHAAPNAHLEQQAAQVRWDTSSPNWIAHTRPLVGSSIANLVPGAELGLAIIGALLAGLVNQLILETLILRKTPLWLAGLSLLSFAATPAFIYLTVGDFASFLGIALLAIGFQGFIAFMVAGDTGAGFAAGIAIGVGIICEPAIAVFAIFFVLAIPFVARPELRHASGSMSATAIVMAFPALAALASWAFVEWRYTGSVTNISHAFPALAQFPNGILNPLVSSASQVAWAILASPLFIVSGILLLISRVRQFVAYLLIPISLVVTLWIGIALPTPSWFVVLGIAGAASLPRLRSRGLRIAVAAAAVLQLAISYGFSSATGIGYHWLHMITG